MEKGVEQGSDAIAGFYLYDVLVFIELIQIKISKICFDFSPDEMGEVFAE